MEDEVLTFYHSKGRLILGIVFTLLCVGFGVLLGSIGYLENSFRMIVLALFIIVLFSIFSVANVLKAIRDYPYIMITNQYIRLDPFTKSEITINFTDIHSIRVPESLPKGIYEIVVYDEDDYFAQLSVHNKVRLCMNRSFNMSLFTISAKALKKHERPGLMKVLMPFQNR